MRCAIYARISNDELQRSESIDDQIRECLNKINTLGGTIDDEHIYKDIGISGSDNYRPEYLRLKEDALNLKFDCVVVHEQSRLSRILSESFKIFEEFNYYGIRIVTVSGGLDTNNPASKTMYFMNNFTSNYDLDIMKDRVLRGMKGQIERGYSAGGRTFGYKYNNQIDQSGAKDKKGNPLRLGVEINIDPEQAKIVTEIFKLKVKGFGIRTITKILNERKIPPPRHSRRTVNAWANSTIWHILKNPTYIGRIEWGKYQYIKLPGTSKKKRIAQPKSEWIIKQREDLRIIEQNIWDVVNSQKNPSGFRNSKPSNNRAKYILSGLLECGQCGGSMIAIPSGEKSTYACSNYRNRGDSVCNNKLRINRFDLENIVMETITERLLNPDMIEIIANEANKELSRIQSSHRESGKSLECKLEKIKTEISNLITFVKQGNSSPSIIEEIEHLEMEKDKLQKQILYSSSTSTLKNNRITKKYIIRKLNDIKNLFLRSEESLKLVQRELKNLLNGRISLNPQDCGNHYKIQGVIKTQLHKILYPELSLSIYGGGGNRTPVRI